MVLSASPSFAIEGQDQRGNMAGNLGFRVPRLFAIAEGLEGTLESRGSFATFPSIAFLWACRIVVILGTEAQKVPPDL
jgi:hypothetical protein